LEAVLPPKPTIEIPKGESVEEVSMVDFESTKGGSSKARSSGGGAQGFFGAEGEEDDEDEMGGAAGGQQFACNTH
jgi:hypothetical protein